MPKQRITKDFILKKAFEIAREKGYESVNARSTAKQAGCSVQPIYSCYKSMEDLMRELFVYTRQFHGRYIEEKADKRNFFESVGRCHVSFAKEEKYLFRLLFMSKYVEAENFEKFYERFVVEEVEEEIQEVLKISKQAARKLYQQMMIYTHGIASMIATDAAKISEEDAHGMVNDAFWAFLAQIRKEKNESNHS